MKKRSKAFNRNLIWAIGIIALVGLVTAIVIGIRVSFENGVKEGREELSAEVSESLKELGTIVSEKAGLAKTIQEKLSDVPKEINTEKIDEQIKKLEELVDEVKSDEIKPILNEYLEKWKSFKEEYAGKDNDAISDAFDTLRADTQDAASKIKSLYDEAMKTAIDKLK